MKKKIVLIAGLSILLLVSMAAPVMAKMEVGVEVGDWFKYEAKVTEWDTTMEFLPDDYLGPLTLADNQTNYVLYTVTAKTLGDGGDNVTFEVEYNWMNGSVTYATVVENVSTANTNIFIIGANMTEGDLISDTWLFLGSVQYPARYLNASFMLDNPNATRATNRLEYSINLMGAPYNYLFWWDNATGIRVRYQNHGVVPEISYQGVSQPAYTYTVDWSLIDSSVDGLLAPDLTGPILLLTIMSLSIPIALLHRRRKRVI